MYYNEVSVENEIILCIFAEIGPYNMTVWFVVHLIVTDTLVVGIGTTHIVKTHSYGEQELPYIVSIDLATTGARASTAMLLS